MHQDPGFDAQHCQKKKKEKKFSHKSRKKNVSFTAKALLKVKRYKVL
jgi:hypothetical protein